MAKFRKFVLALCLVLALAFMLYACDNDQGTDTGANTNTDTSTPTEYIVTEAQGFEIDTTGPVIKLSKIVSSQVETIDLSRAFSTTEGATWRLYKDYLGEEEYRLKSMLLSSGENKAYLVVYHPNGEDFVRYEVNIYRFDIKDFAFVADGTTVNSGTVEELSCLNAPDSIPQKNGYAFDYWSVNGERVDFPFVIENDTEFVAKWKANNNTLAFNANGGDGTMENITIATDSSVNLSANAFTKANYTFLGWSTSANGKVEYIDGASYTMGTESSYTLYAVWRAIPYNIEYRLNNGTNRYNPSVYTVEQEIILKNPTRDGYCFGGWYTDSSFTNKVTSIATGSTGDKTFFARWTPNNNTLVFNANGGDGTMENMTIATDSSVTLSANAFTKAGCTFLGWSTSANGKVEYIDGASYTMGTKSSYTLYAVWNRECSSIIEETIFYPGIGTTTLKELIDNGIISENYEQMYSRGDLTEEQYNAIKAYMSQLGDNNQE